MRDGAVGVNLYNAQVTGGGVGDAPPRQLGRGPHPVRDHAYGVCFDANMVFPLIADCSHTIYHGTCPGCKNGVIVTL